MNNGATTLNQLESHLWEAANILRGPVDAADFKTYVFPLLRENRAAGRIEN
jgi:type I restriction enzyme M protein